MKNLDQLELFSKKIKGKLLFNYELKKTNWFNIGGKTKAYFKPDSLSELILFLKEFGEVEKIFTLGAGSNLLISEEFFDGVIIKLGKNFSQISILPDKIIVAGSATSDKKLSEFACENNVSGLEFLNCIPGTIGGGLKMNSGCFHREFKDIVVSVQAINKKGQVFSIPSSQINFEYRKSDFNPGLIFLSASFKGKTVEKNEILALMKNLKDKKDFTQPTKIKTGGSTFKNPINHTDKKVWELIKQSVPLDTRYGDAAISQKHCNFLINEKNASAKDMKKLIEFIKKEVKCKTGIVLETEIEII